MCGHNVRVYGHWSVCTEIVKMFRAKISESVCTDIVKMFMDTNNTQIAHKIVTIAINSGLSQITVVSVRYFAI